MAGLRKYLSLFSTTSNSFGTGEGVTITPGSVVGLPAGNIVLTFDRVDSSGVASPTTMERIMGAVSGGNFVVASGGRGYDNSTEQAHTSPVTEMVWNAADWNDAIAALTNVTSATTGALDTTKVVDLTTAQVLTNKILNADGWTLANETWTYASASTITIPAGGAAKYAVGDRIKFTQTTVKYGVIVTVADTLLTIAVNTDYTVANAAITLNYYSHQASPIGYPQWFAAAAPTFDIASIDNGSGGQPTVSEYRISITGRTYTAHLRGTGTKVGATNTINWTSPIAVVNYTNRAIIGGGYTGTAADLNSPAVIITISSTAFYLFNNAALADNVVLANFGFNISFEI